MVHEAPDGQAALEFLRTRSESLVVLLDLLMPVTGGFALLETAAASPPLLTEHAYLIVAATRRIPPPNAAAIIDQCNIPFIQKPFELNELLAAVQTAASTLH